MARSSISDLISNNNSPYYNSNDSSAIKLNELNAGNSPDPPRKKRKSTIKSCTFCRKRKLKCDKAKPMCSTCKGRNFIECIYSQTDTTVVSPPNSSSAIIQQTMSTSTSPNTPSIQTNSSINLMDYPKWNINVTGPTAGVTQPLSSWMNNSSNKENMKKEFRTQYVQPFGVANQMLLPPSQRSQFRFCHPKLHKSIGYCSNNTTATQWNPLSNIYFAKQKLDGRTITFGPTSLMCFTHMGGRFLFLGQQHLWNSVKVTRRRWKEYHKFSMFKEFDTLTDPFMELGTDIVKEMCKCLPSFDEIISIIEFFFNETELFAYSNVLDQNKVMSDLYNCFKVENIDDKRVVTDLIVDRKRKNYFRSSIILMIICLTKFEGQIPSKVETFLVMLAGFSVAKIYYIERAQFIFLRIIHRMLYLSNDGDNSPLIELSNSLGNTCCALGLNQDINLIYDKMENVVGRMETLHNLFIWTTYLDFVISYEVGKPVFMHRDFIYNLDERLDDKSKSFMGLMKRFLKLSLPMINEIFSTHVSNSATFMKDQEERLLQFIENEFPPLTCFVDRKEIFKVDFNSCRIFTATLGMLIGNYCMRFAYLEEHTKQVSQGIMKSTLLALDFSSVLMLRAYMLDNAQFSNKCDKDYPSIAPYMALATSIIESLTARSMCCFMVMLYYRLTDITSGPVLLLNPSPEKDYTITPDLFRNQNKWFPLLAAFNFFSEIFTRWTHPENAHLQQLMRKSYFFVISSTVERMWREIFTRLVEHRKQLEEEWVTRNRPKIGADVVNNVESQNKFPNQNNDQLTPQSDANHSDGYPTYVDNINKPSDSQDAWFQYNAGFANVFEQIGEEITDGLALLDDLALFG